MFDSILTLLGSTLFLPLAVTYVIAALAGLVVLGMRRQDRRR